MKLSSHKFMILMLLMAVSTISRGALSTEPHPLDEHEFYSDWFESFNDTHDPWIYHYKHGWMYYEPDPGSGYWFWSLGLGWAWTSERVYPNFFSENRGWIFYELDSLEPRNFFAYSTREWVNDAPYLKHLSYFPTPEPDEFFWWRFEVNGGIPLEVFIEGQETVFSFTLAEATFSGLSMEHNLDLHAEIYGTLYVEGYPYPFAGDISVHAQDHYTQDVLGVYGIFSDAEMNMLMTVEEVDLQLVESSSVSHPGNKLVNFMARCDLWKFPVGTVFDQQTTHAFVEANDSFYIDGELDSRDSSSHVFFMEQKIEILSKLTSYAIGGRVFHQVVVVQETNISRDVAGGVIGSSVYHRWLAPGIGMIRTVGDMPGFNSQLDLVLESTNLW